MKPPKVHVAIVRPPKLGGGQVAPAKVYGHPLTGGVGISPFDKYKKWLHIDGGNPYSTYGTEPMEGGTP
jgi:hypothetical protein